MTHYTDQNKLILGSVFCFVFVFALVLFFSAPKANAELKDVSYSNYPEVQTYFQMQAYQKLAGKVNEWYHFKEPTPISNQPTIRMNRDTFYSIAVVNVSEGALVTLPNADNRYTSIAIENMYGYTPLVFYGRGQYILNPENVGSDYALVLVRTFVDPNSSDDVKTVNNLQNIYTVSANNNTPLPKIEWNMEQYDAVHKSLAEIFKLAKSASSMFGKKEEVDPIYFLLGAAGGFGGLSSEHAIYINGMPSQQADGYSLQFANVPVDGFWSVTVYNKEGYLFEDEYGLPSVNSVTATQNDDHSYTVNFGLCEDGRVNCLAIEDGWNYIVRFYRPRADLRSGKWQLPELQPLQASQNRLGAAPQNKADSASPSNKAASTSNANNK